MGEVSDRSALYLPYCISGAKLMCSFSSFANLKNQISFFMLDSILYISFLYVVFSERIRFAEVLREFVGIQDIGAEMALDSYVNREY